MQSNIKNKKNWASIFLLIILILSGCQAQPDSYDSQGKPIRLSDYRGKWVVVNFWATWCSPCLSELPELNKLHQNHSDKVVVLGVNFDQLSNPDIQAFAQQHSLAFPLLGQFPLERLGIKQVQTLPMTIVLNQQGKVTQILHGPQTQATLLKTLQF